VISSPFIQTSWLSAEQICQLCFVHQFEFMASCIADIYMETETWSSREVLHALLHWRGSEWLMLNETKLWLLARTWDENIYLAISSWQTFTLTIIFLCSLLSHDIGQPA
jgi:hypothetical protein